MSVVLRFVPKPVAATLRIVDTSGLRLGVDTAIMIVSASILETVKVRASGDHSRETNMDQMNKGTESPTYVLFRVCT